MVGLYVPDHPLGLFSLTLHLRVGSPEVLQTRQPALEGWDSLRSLCMPLGLRRYTEGLLGLLQTQDLPEAMEPKLRVTHPLGVRNSKHKQRSGR